ncbi:hypothetical protein AVEN_166810-1 [Araneus ventricosus]|uniref:BTB domain-containing protein n=1 Tax=Araneus ventricosus TaxID=182803 RepID=A0A4Y2BNK1_ARAVE|nr:hypothetical protein AVEN_166810-1 [Araneus ventricosus]
MADNWIHKVRSNTLQKRLFADLEMGIFTDITFRVGPVGNQRTFKAHRLVLASENSEFEKMLHESGETGKIKIPDVHPKGFENLIRYCYGESFIFKDLASIRETYIAAEKFKAKKLQLTTENNLIDLLKSESLIKILNVCIELNMPRAKERCLGVISSRLEKVLMTEELISAPLDVIETILCLCPDRELHLKMSALCTILAWAKRRQCPDVVTRHLLSMMQYERIPPHVIISFFKRKGEQLTESQFRVLPEGLSSKVCSPIKNLFLEITNAVGNTVFSLADTKVESSEVEQETSLEEEKVVTDGVQASGLKDKKEIVVDREETSKLGGEKISDTNYDSDDDSVIDENVIKDFIEDASNLIERSVADSSRETVSTIINATEKLTKHAAEKMQKAVDDMVDSFNSLVTCKSNTSLKTEVKST